MEIRTNVVRLSGGRLIGDVKLDELTPRLMDKFYQSLLKVKTKSVQNKKPKNEYLTVHTVREIHKFLRSAFNQAVKWELMTRNPVLNATLPKEEGQVINRALKKLIQDNDLPDVVFHSFRHASITYKLKWNGGDMKSVQGDSGHARMDMVADVYSHIIDEDSVACWVYVQKYVKHKTLNEMLQELPDVGQFILAMDTWFEKLMEK